MTEQNEPDPQEKDEAKSTPQSEKSGIAYEHGQHKFGSATSGPAEPEKQ